MLGAYGQIPMPTYDEKLANQAIDQFGEIFEKLKERLGSMNVDDNLILNMCHSIRTESMRYTDAQDAQAQVGAGIGGLLGGYAHPAKQAWLQEMMSAQLRDSELLAAADKDEPAKRKAPSQVLTALTMLIEHFGEDAVRAGLEALEPMMAERRKQETKSADSAATS
jgi:hypothetical protein